MLYEVFQRIFFLNYNHMFYSIETAYILGLWDWLMTFAPVISLVIYSFKVRLRMFIKWLAK